eukprot:15693-Heterococcus_DN1.PRE.3
MASTATGLPLERLTLLRYTSSASRLVTQVASAGSDSSTSASSSGSSSTMSGAFILVNDQKITYQTIHYGSTAKREMQSCGFSANSGTFANSYHTYAVEWAPWGQMKFYVDGILGCSMNQWFTTGANGAFPAPFNMQFYLILNLAVGGNWPGWVDDAQFSDGKRVAAFFDYVRTYSWPTGRRLDDGACFFLQRTFIKELSTNIIPHIGTLQCGSLLVLLASDVTQLSMLCLNARPYTAATSAADATSNTSNADTLCANTTAAAIAAATAAVAVVLQQ